MEEPVPVHKFASPSDEIGTNPVETMGTREDYTDVKFLEFSKIVLEFFKIENDSLSQTEGCLLLYIT